MTTTTDEVVFPTPDEIEGFWALDKMHAPRPITPLSFDLIVHTLAEGFTKAQAEYDCPIMVTTKEINHFFYVSFHPIPDEAEIAAADGALPREARRQGARRSARRGRRSGSPTSSPRTSR